MSFTVEGISPPVMYKKKNDPRSGVVQSSADLVRSIAAENRPVCAAFSRGKDSIGVMVQLLAAGCEVYPVHFYRAPGLSFEDDSLKYFEDLFQLKIWNLPHPDLWYSLAECVSLPPYLNSVIMATGIEKIPYALTWELFKQSQGLDSDTWVCDGVRAADSPYRRMALLKNGPKTRTIKHVDSIECIDSKARVVWDWKMKEIRQCLEINNIQLPIDYDLFGRTFDGLDYRFISVLRDKLPDDFQKILELFPAADMELMRYEFLEKEKYTQ